MSESDFPGQTAASPTDGSPTDDSPRQTEPTEAKSRVERASSTRTLETASVILGLAVLTGLLLGVERSSGPVLASFYDAAHVWLSALLVIVGARIDAQWRASRLRPRDLGIIMFLVASAGLGLELAQFLTHGTASSEDFGRDLIGTSAGAAWVVRGQCVSGRDRAKVIRRGLATSFALVNLGASVPLICSLAVSERHRLWPTEIFEPDNLVSRLAAKVGGGAEIRYVDHLPSAAKQGTQSVARMSFGRHHYPNLHIQGPFADFSDYSQLSIAAFSPSRDTWTMVLRLQDRKYDGHYDDAFTLALDVVEGANHWRIPVSELHSRSGRPLDLLGTNSITLFTVDPKEPREFYLLFLSLE